MASKTNWDAEARELTDRIMYPSTYITGTDRVVVARWIAALARRAEREALERGAGRTRDSDALLAWLARFVNGHMASHDCVKCRETVKAFVRDPVGAELVAAIRREIEGTARPAEAQG